MIPAQFEYHAATSVDEALKLLGQYGDDAKLLAGGHSLIPALKLRLQSVGHLIDLGKIKGLDSIKEAGGKISIGALTTHQAVESSDLVKKRCALLAECAGYIGDVQVRNRGTIGGSLSHADPAADYPAAIAAAAAHAADGVDPLNDIHASAAFRAHLAQVNTRRALERAIARA